jgi:general nucleoside transport system permease protein
LDAAFLLDFLAAALRIATPLMLAALGGILAERAGTFAVGLEGQMLAGAFFGVLTTHAASSAGLGLAASALGGAAMALVVMIATVRFQAEHMVTGIASNILALGLTSFLLRAAAGGGSAPSIRVPLLEAWAVPGLSALPLVGPLLFRQPPLTYLALLLVVPLVLFLFRTRAGLTLRAVGENPVAAFAAGANPDRVRALAILAGGALAGLAGAVLSLQQVGTFTDGMTGGRGYLVLAAIIVGRWMPLGTLVACLVFGAAEALSLRVQAFSLPVSSYVIQMAPYLAALTVLAVLGRGARMPAAVGQPFRRS